MKKFNFRLEKLLMLKEYAEMEAKLKYASVLQKKLDIENENRNIQKSIIKSLSDSYKQTDEGEAINLDLLSIQEEYITNLISKIEINDGKKQDIEKKLTVLREELTFTTKERKVMDELKNKSYLKYRKEAKKEEIKEIDDIAGKYKQIIAMEELQNDRQR